jgi:hypothetical protein
MADDFSLGAIFAELAPTRQKWLRALRVASITALGAGLMATMQIANPLGLTMLVNLSLPEAGFPLTRGLVFLFSAAVFQTLTVALAAALANSPPLELTVFIVLSLVTSYLIYAVPILGRLWLWIQVPVVTSFFMVLFMPTELGWDNAQMFSGLAIAVAMLLLCNNLIWPTPVRIVLTHSLVETIERSRTRFARLIAIAVGAAAPDEDRPVASRLGHHIALVAQIHEMSRPGELGRMLGFIMSAERIHNQLVRVASLVSQMPAAFSKSDPAIELRALAGAIDEQFEGLISRLRQELTGRAAAAAGLSQHTTPSDLSARVSKIARDYPELERLAATVAQFATLTGDSLLDLLHNDDPIADDPFALSRGSDPFLVRFAVRHTLALTIAFLLGLWDNSAALHAAIWLLMLGGPPSHGATPRKFMMRALGASGALALAALGTIIVAPNYTSLAPYMAVIFIGVLVMAYVGEGGGILSYLAIGGTAFVIAYSGPGPRSDVLGSLWSVWGISVGMIIRAALTLLWREHSYRTLAEEFQPPLAAISELSRGSEGPSDVSRRTAARTRVLRSVQVMLGVANDALLEGRSAEIDPDKLIEALETLLHLAFLLGPPESSTTKNEPAISPALTNAIRLRCEAWLERLSVETESGSISPAPLRRMIFEAVVPPLDLTLAPAESSESTPTELDRRIINLTLLLEQQLSAISLNRC